MYLFSDLAIQFSIQDGGLVHGNRQEWPRQQYVRRTKFRWPGWNLDCSTLPVLFNVTIYSADLLMVKFLQQPLALVPPNSCAAQFTWLTFSSKRFRLVKLPWCIMWLTEINVRATESAEQDKPAHTCRLILVYTLQKNTTGKISVNHHNAPTD